MNTPNPFPEMITVPEGDVEVHNPEFATWQAGYEAALMDVARTSWVKNRLIPLALTEVAGTELVNEALKEYTTSNSNRLRLK